MTRRLGPLTLGTLADLPPSCRRCVAWELDTVAARQAGRAGDLELEKEAWLSGLLLEWGTCGRIAYDGDEPTGFVSYAPPAWSPRASALATSPVAADAVLLMTAWVAPGHRGGGIARMLVQGAAKDVTRRGVRALEAFGLAADAEPDQGAVLPDVEQGVADHVCLLPADLLTAVGFRTVREHPVTPRLRLDLRTALSWREDVEAALERILGQANVPVLSST